MGLLGGGRGGPILRARYGRGLLILHFWRVHALSMRAYCAEKIGHGRFGFKEEIKKQMQWICQ